MKLEEYRERKLRKRERCSRGDIIRVSEVHHSSHSVLSGPFSGGCLELGLVSLVDVSNFWH